MFQIIKRGVVIPFMKIATIVEVICLALVIGSIYLLCTKGLTWGLDFTGGAVVEISYPQEVDLNKVRGDRKSVV